jgi:DNA-binding NtrC family response regulator
MTGSAARLPSVSSPDQDLPAGPLDKRRLSILVVDDEAGIRNFLQRIFAREYGLVEAADSAETAEPLRQRYQFDLLIVDVRLPGRSGLDWIRDLRSQGVDTDVIFITAYADLTSTIDALRSGAADFLLKPFRQEQMLTAVEHCFERRLLRHENVVLRRQVNSFADRLYGRAGIQGESAAMKAVCEIIERAAPTPSSVLIEGETGTGKELVANAVHRLSGRRGAFVPVSCVAISPELFESELFGHAKGAFTGAHQAREGLITSAAGGTLFLDEVSEMPLPMQAKLLRVLEDRHVRQVGSDRELAVDVRLVAATNRNLQTAVREGRFREDLYYRLNVVSLKLPALRERVEDIPELAAFFSEKLAAELGARPYVFSKEDQIRLQTYAWPGNVRELKNLVERTLLLGRFPWEAFADSISLSDQGGRGDPLASVSAVARTLEEIEKEHMLRVLEAAGGNKSEAARQLGISRKTMERKLRSWSADG